MADKTGNFGTVPFLWHDNGDGTYSPTVYNTGAGGVGGGGTEYSEDTPSTAADKLTMAGVVRKDSAAALVDTDGDRTQLITDADGKLWVNAGAGGSAGTQYTEGDTDATITGTALMWEDASDTLRAVSAAKPLPISDAGGSLTVDGTVTVQDGGGSITVDGTFWQATQPVSGTFWQATQPVSGPLTDAQLRAAVVPISDGGGSLTVDGSVTATGPLTDTQLRATAVPVSDGGSTLSIDDGAGSITVDGTFWQATQPVSGTFWQATQPVSGTVISNQGSAGTAWEVVGDVANDIAVPANPVTVGGRASTALPTAVSADGDSVYAWLLRNGAQMTALLPHLGWIGEPYTLTSKTVQVTTAQTGSDVWSPASGKKLVITYFQMQAGGTTAATVQLWFGANADTSYTRGSDLSLFDGEFAPSATLKPGIAQTGLWIASAADHEVHLTTSAGITLTVTLWGYEI